MEMRRKGESLRKKLREKIVPNKKGLKANSRSLQKIKLGSVALRMEGITKSFQGVLANDRINFDVRKGEIHGLLGENGAGKTTLMHILYGLYQPDKGHIFVGDKRLDPRSPLDAMEAGIGMVHQHFMLIPVFTVAENIALGLNLPGIVLDIEKVKEVINDLSSKYGLEVDSDAKVWQLSVGEQQRVEIIKALSQGADLLILDEPTSVLTPKEVAELFLILRSMANQGLSIIFITHKLDEVLSVSDRITVLRSGKVVSTIETHNANKEELARMMVGRDISFECKNAPCRKGNVILKIEALCAANDRGLDAVRNVSLEVCEGEILGIAGVAGNGQKELVDVVTGLRRAAKGRILVSGRDVTNQSPKKIIEEKVTCVPEDRVTEGLILDFNIAENLILKSFSSSPYSKRGLLNLKEISVHAEKLVSEFDVKTPTIYSPARNLSGGNLQKLLLARELSQQPKILIAASPTKGLDVGATEYIHRKLLEQRRDGKAILLVSEDLDELLVMSDRLAVMYQGRVVGLLERNRFNIEEIGLMMTGAKKKLD